MFTSKAHFSAGSGQPFAGCCGALPRAAKSQYVAKIPVRVPRCLVAAQVSALIARVEAVVPGKCPD